MVLNRTEHNMINTLKDYFGCLSNVKKRFQRGKEDKQRNNFRDYCKNQVRDNVVWSKVIAVRYWQDIRIGKPYHFLTVWM